MKEIEEIGQELEMKAKEKEKGKACAVDKKVYFQNPKQQNVSKIKNLMKHAEFRWAEFGTVQMVLEYISFDCLLILSRLGFCGLKEFEVGGRGGC